MGGQPEGESVQSTTLPWPLGADQGVTRRPSSPGGLRKTPHWPFAIYQQSCSPSSSQAAPRTHTCLRPGHNFPVSQTGFFLSIRLVAAKGDPCSPSLSASRNHGDQWASAGVWLCVAGALPGPGHGMVGTLGPKPEGSGVIPYTAHQPVVCRPHGAGLLPARVYCPPRHPGPLCPLLPTPGTSQRLQSRLFFRMEQLPLIPVVSGNFNEVRAVLCLTVV